MTPRGSPKRSTKGSFKESTPGGHPRHPKGSSKGSTRASPWDTRKGSPRKSPRGSTMRRRRRSQGILQYLPGGILWGEDPLVPRRFPRRAPGGGAPGGLPRGIGIGSIWVCRLHFACKFGGIPSLCKVVFDLLKGENNMALPKHPKCCPGYVGTIHNLNYETPQSETNVD